MTARDKWISVTDEGKILLKSENDGWAFMRKGPQATEEEITLETVKNYYPKYYDRVIEELSQLKGETL